MKNDNGTIIIGAVVAVLLDVIISPNVPLLSGTPNFMIVYSLVVSILSHSRIVYGVAFALGLVADLLGFGPVGLLSILLLLAALVIRTYFSDFSSSRGAGNVIALFLVVLAVEVLHALGTVLFMTGVDPVNAVVYVALPCSVLDCLFGVLVYLVMRRLIQPARTSFGKKPPRLRRY